MTEKSILRLMTWGWVIPNLPDMKKLLLAGAIGPLVFIAVSLLEGATRPGYSAWRHYVSQLATGEFGWMQVINFLICGVNVSHALWRAGPRLVDAAPHETQAGP